MEKAKYGSAARSNVDGQWYTGGRYHTNDFTMAKADVDISHQDNDQKQYGVMDMQTKEIIYTAGEYQPKPQKRSRGR